MRGVKRNSGLVRFGDPKQIGVERGITEFRAGRPILVTEEQNVFLVLPVDGIDAEQLSTFLKVCAPVSPRLAITTRRAQAIGIETTEPVTIKPDVIDIEKILLLVSKTSGNCLLDAAPAVPAVRAALDLAKLAQRLPAVLVVEGAGTKVPFDPPLVSVAADAIAQFRRTIMDSVKITGEANVPLEGGVQSRFVVFRNDLGGDSVAVIVGKPDFTKPVPVRLHSSCLTGDVFGSQRCDCGDQLRLALKKLKAAGGGVILYLDQEGRGLGLANKMRAYQLQDEGFDTVDANMSLGFDDDERDYGVAGRMLEMLGCQSVQLFTNNPAKISGLTDAGIEVSGRKALLGPVNVDNRRYLTAKATRAGHSLDHLLETLTTAVETPDPVGADAERETSSRS